MTSRNGELTLRDLVGWVPAFSVVNAGAVSGGGAAIDNDVEWVVSARAGAPMLPALRGGELVIMPQRVIADSTVPLNMLLAELSTQPVAGIVVDDPDARLDSSRLPVLRVPRISAELENDLNRMLTARRGDLLRMGADIEREISELTARNARPGEMIESLAARLGLGITVASTSGAVLFSTNERSGARPPFANREGTTDEWIKQPLLHQRMLWIGPIVQHQRALGRLVVRRLRETIQRSLDQAEATAPQGAARINALNALLRPASGTTDEQIASNALLAGLGTGTHLRVILQQPGVLDPDTRRRIGRYGSSHDAGMIDGMATHIVAVLESRARTVQVAHPTVPEPGLGLSVSNVVHSPRALPEALRQAQFVAGLQRQGLLKSREVRFDDDVQLGAFRLLYDRWGSPELTRYVNHLIGDLIREDRRGLLRETLRVYLEHGGAQRPTAERLGIHRNTLTYRLKQIRSVVDLDSDDPQNRLGLHLALLAAELPADGATSIRT